VSLAPDAPLHLHIAEQVKEVNDCIAWCGRRPVEWLLDHHPVDERWCLVHATQCQCRGGASPGRECFCRGSVPDHGGELGRRNLPCAGIPGRWRACGIGTDSNVLVNAAEELRCSNTHSASPTADATCSRAVLSTRRAGASWKRRVAGGAQASGTIGADSSRGRMRILSASTPHTIRCCPTWRCAPRQLDFRRACAGDRLRWRYGRKVVSGGRHIGRDAITARYRRVLASCSAHNQSMVIVAPVAVPLARFMLVGLDSRVKVPTDCGIPHPRRQIVDPRAQALTRRTAGHAAERDAA